MRIASPLTTEPHPILQWIEIATSLQLPSFHIIGLASPEVAEARERVRAAIESSGFEFPRRRIVINLSPASIRKRGTGSDLAMAMGILWASSDRPALHYQGGIVASGELGLDGQVKPVGQVMRTLHAAWEAGAEAIFLSKEDDAEAQRYLPILKSASLFECPFPTLIAVSNLVEAWQKIKFGAYADPAHLASIVPFYERRNISSEGLLSLRPELEKWVQIAAAGLHHLLLLGPRGAGKSHAFEWLIRLQPEASAEIQVRQILIRELLGSEKIRLDSGPPIRRVGTQVRSQALYGGSTGGTLKPGEFSLAHGGVLLADELPEWPRDSREALREPLERGVVTLTRTQSTAELPAQFVLAANGNLCPCGGWPRLLRKAHVGIPLTHFRCSCKDSEVIAYLKRLSGPILDRIDIIQLVIPRSPDERELTSVSLSFAQLRERIAHAQDLGRKLWGLPPGLLPASEVEMILKDYPAWREALDHRKELGLRSRHKIARIALSLAIYESVGAKQNSSMPPLPSERHFEEAFYMRPEGIQIQV